MSLSRRGDRSPLLGRNLRTAPLVVTEQRQAVTEVITEPAPPEATAKTEVISEPAQPAAPELVHLGAQKEEALAAFDGRPLSSSVAAREAWFRENPGPEPTFRGLVADLAAFREANPDPGPGEPGEDADPVPADVPAAPGPVTAAKNGAGRPAAKKRPKAAGA